MQTDGNGCKGVDGYQARESWCIWARTNSGSKHSSDESRRENNQDQKLSRKLF
jgi:hypothetical protein